MVGIELVCQWVVGRQWVLFGGWGWDGRGGRSGISIGHEYIGDNSRKGGCGLAHRQVAGMGVNWVVGRWQGWAQIGLLVGGRSAVGFCLVGGVGYIA